MDINNFFEKDLESFYDSKEESDEYEDLDELYEVMIEEEKIYDRKLSHDLFGDDDFYFEDYDDEENY